MQVYGLLAASRRAAAVLLLALSCGANGVGLPPLSGAELPAPKSTALQSLSVVRQTMVGHLDTVNCLEMIDSGRLLFSGSEDGTMRAYDSAPFPPDHG
jgi:hypothetical protein